jgi:glycerophosphoryl diester phosphodiesterase
MYYGYDGTELNAVYAFDGNKLWDMLQEYTRQYILHGTATKRPPNSMLLFEWGYENGYRFVEADIFVTSDGVPVLCHDATINNRARNDDGTALTETVTIEGTTYAELLQYDFGLTVNPQYPKTRIATLAELLDFCVEHELLFMADVKRMSRTDALTIIHNMVADKGMIDRCVWCVPNSTAMTELTTKSHNLVVEVEGNISNATPLSNKTRAVFIGSSSYDTVFTAEMIANAHAQGFFTNAWTVNNQDMADSLWENGCDFITTNVLLNSSVPE